MADVCPNCKSGETEPGADRSFCLNCGGFFHVNGEGETVVTDADEVFSVADPGPLEPETKGGRGIPVSSTGGSTESALQQEGALPQHGIPGRGGNAQTSAYDTPSGFTAPAGFNERLDPLAEGLAGATTRVEELLVVEEFVASGDAPQVVSKVDSQNADALGSPVAAAPLNPVHLDTADHGATDEQPVLDNEVIDTPTPGTNPDSLPAQKTAEQHGTGEVVNPPTATEPDPAGYQSQDVAAPTPVPVAPPLAANATPAEAEKTAAGLPVVDSNATPASPSTDVNASQPEPAALDTPGATAPDHDPAQNTPAAQEATNG